jgi:hypothetical protein
VYTCSTGCPELQLCGNPVSHPSPQAEHRRGVILSVAFSRSIAPVILPLQLRLCQLHLQQDARRLNTGVECQLAWSSSTSTIIQSRSFHCPPFSSRINLSPRFIHPPLSDGPVKAIVVRNPALAAAIQEMIAREALPRRFPPQRRDHRLGGHRREFYAPCQCVRIDYEDVRSRAEWGRWAQL